MRLEPCPACQRHVRTDERACPFCGHDVRALAALPARPMPTRRLGRAALFAFGIGAATSASAGCIEAPDSDDDDGDERGKDGGQASGDAGKDGGNVVALYGLAVPDGGFGGGQPGGALIDSGAGGAPGGVLAMYGGAPPPDAGGASDAGVPRDASFDAGGVVALYGVAPPPAAKDAGPGGDLGGVIALYGVAPAPEPDALRDAGFGVPHYGLAPPPDETS